MVRLKALLLLLPLTLTIVAACWLLDRDLERRMAALKVAIIRELEDRLERPIRYGSLAPSIFGFLDLRDLQIGGDAEGSTLLRINRLRVHYSLPRLLLERDIGRSISEITLFHSTFTVDLERDRELLELVRRLVLQPEGAGRSGGLPAIRISGDDITLDVRRGGEAVHLSRLFFTLSSLADAFQVTLRAAVETRGRYPASARVRLDGRVDRSLAGSDLLVRLEALRTGSFSLERQTLQVSHHGRRLDVRKIQDRAPLDLHVVYDLDRRHLSVRLMSQDFKPATMLTLQGPLQRYQPFLQNPYSISGEVALSLAERSLRYDLDLRTNLSGKLLPFPVELSGHLAGDRELMQLRPIRLASERGRLEFDGSILLRNLFPDGLLQLAEVRALPGEPLSASLELVRGARSVQLNGGKLVLGPLALKDVALELTPQPDRFLFDLRTSLDGAGSPGTLRSRGQLVFRSGSAGPQVGFRAFRQRLASGVKGRGLLSGLELQADNVLEAVPLSFLRSVLPAIPRLPEPLERALGGLRLSASLTLGTDFEGFRLSAPLVRIDDPGDRDHGVLTSLHADPGSIALQDFSARWGGYRLSGDLSATLLPERDVRARVAFRWLEVPYELKARWKPGGPLELSGSYGLSAQIVFPPPSPASPVQLLPGIDLPFPLPGVRGVRFSLQAEDVPLPLPGRIGRVLASTRLEGEVDGEGRLRLESGRTVVRDFPLFKSRENRLETAFLLERGLLQLRRVSFTDRFSTLEGSGRVAIRSLSDFEGTLQLDGRGSGESYSLRVRPRPGRLDSSLAFRQSPLSRFGEYWVSGSLSGEARLEGTLAQPLLSGSLRLDDGLINEDPVGLSLDWRYQPGEVRLSALNLSFLTHRVREGEGRLDFAGGAYRFQSQYQGDYAGKRLRLRTILEGTFNGMGAEALRPFVLPVTASSIAPAKDTRAVNVLLRQAGLQGALQLTDIRVDDRPSAPWTFVMREENETVSLSGGPERSIRGHFDLDGHFGLELLAPLPVRGKVTGRLDGKTIDSRFAVSFLDARVINFAAPTEVFRFTSGVGRGELRITGSVNDPDFFGRLAVSGGACASPSPRIPWSRSRGCWSSTRRASTCSAPSPAAAVRRWSPAAASPSTTGCPTPSSCSSESRGTTGCRSAIPSVRSTPTASPGGTSRSAGTAPRCASRGTSWSIAARSRSRSRSRRRLLLPRPTR